MLVILKADQHLITRTGFIQVKYLQLEPANPEVKLWNRKITQITINTTLSFKTAIEQCTHIICTL